MYYLTAVKFDDETVKLEPSLFTALRLPRTGRNATIPRVEMYRYIRDGLRALPKLHPRSLVHVYTIEQNVSIAHPTVEQLPEVNITHALWTYNPITVRYKGTLEILNKIAEIHLTQPNGEELAVFYDYDWKWVKMKV